MVKTGVQYTTRELGTDLEGVHELYARIKAGESLTPESRNALHVFGKRIFGPYDLEVGQTAKRTVKGTLYARVIMADGKEVTVFVSDGNRPNLGNIIEPGSLDFVIKHHRTPLYATIERTSLSNRSERFRTPFSIAVKEFCYEDRIWGPCYADFVADLEWAVERARGEGRHGVEQAAIEAKHVLDMDIVDSVAFRHVDTPRYEGRSTTVRKQPEGAKKLHSAFEEFIAGSSNPSALERALQDIGDASDAQSTVVYLDRWAWNVYVDYTIIMDKLQTGTDLELQIESYTEGRISSQDLLWNILAYVADHPEKASAFAAAVHNDMMNTYNSHPMRNVWPISRFPLQIAGKHDPEFYERAFADRLASHGVELPTGSEHPSAICAFMRFAWGIRDGNYLVGADDQAERQPLYERHFLGLALHHVQQHYGLDSVPLPAGDVESARSHVLETILQGSQR